MFGVELDNIAEREDGLVVLASQSVVPGPGIVPHHRAYGHTAGAGRRFFGFDAAVVLAQKFRVLQRALAFFPATQSKVDTGNAEIYLGQIRVELRGFFQSHQTLLVLSLSAVSQAQLVESLGIFRSVGGSFLNIG